MADDASSPLLTVVTWNVHDGRGDLARLLNDLTSGALGAPARDYVLLLQEAVDVETIAAARGLAVFHVPVFAGQSRARGTAILSTLPLRDPRAIDLPHERQHRVVSTATVDVDGRQLFVASAHFENRLAMFGGGPFADQARGRQAEALVAALPRDVPGIVGGDLNTILGPGEPALRILRERFSDTPVTQSAPTFHNRLVLDHLFVDLPDGWTAARRVVARRYGSDHHPVLGAITAG